MKKILLIAVLLGAMLSVTVYFVCIAAPVSYTHLTLPTIA